MIDKIKQFIGKKITFSKILSILGVSITLIFKPMIENHLNINLSDFSTVIMILFFVVIVYLILKKEKDDGDWFLIFMVISFIMYFVYNKEIDQRSEYEKCIDRNKKESFGAEKEFAFKVCDHYKTKNL